MPNGNHKLNLFFSQNKFLGSFKNISEIPNINLPEYCFVGRSNVNIQRCVSSIRILQGIQLLLVDFSYNSANWAAVKNWTPEKVFM